MNDADTDEDEVKHPAKQRQRLVEEVTTYFENPDNHIAAGIPLDFKFNSSSYFVLTNEITRGNWKIGEKLPQSVMSYITKRTKYNGKNPATPTPPSPATPPLAPGPSGLHPSWASPAPLQLQAAVGPPAAAAADRSTLLISVIQHVQTMPSFSEDERIRLCVKLSTTIDHSILINLNSIISLTASSPLMSTVLYEILKTHL